MPIAGSSSPPRSDNDAVPEEAPRPAVAVPGGPPERPSNPNARVLLGGQDGNDSRPPLPPNDDGSDVDSDNAAAPTPPNFVGGEDEAPIPATNEEGPHGSSSPPAEGGAESNRQQRIGRREDNPDPEEVPLCPTLRPCSSPPALVDSVMTGATPPRPRPQHPLPLVRSREREREPRTSPSSPPRQRRRRTSPDGIGGELSGDNGNGGGAGGGGDHDIDGSSSGVESSSTSGGSCSSAVAVDDEEEDDDVCGAGGVGGVGDSGSSGNRGHRRHRAPIKYYILKTTYPTLYGPNRGARGYTNAELSAETVYEKMPPLDGYDRYEDAVLGARRVRNANEWFIGACEPMSDEEEMGNYLRDPDTDRYIFGHDDDPPWRSEDLEDYSRDVEVVISVATEDKFLAILEGLYKNKRIAQRQRRQRFEMWVQSKEWRMRVRESGRAHYSHPPRCDVDEEPVAVASDWDVPADMEVRESEDPGADALRKVRPDADGMRSIMYRGCDRGGMGMFLNYCETADEEADNCNGNGEGDKSKIKEITDDQLKREGILRHLRACTSLEELHLQFSLVSPVALPSKDNKSKQATANGHPRQPVCSAHVTSSFIRHLISQAPHLERGLKILSFGPSLFLKPSVLSTIGACFPSLERLDISHAFGVLYLHNGPAFPYGEPLAECVAAMKLLRRVDLGAATIKTGGSEPPRRLTDMCVSRATLEDVRKTLRSRGGNLTENRDNVPPEWPSRDAALRGRFLAVRGVAQDSEIDDAVRTMAMDEFKRMSGAVNPQQHHHQQQQHQQHHNQQFHQQGPRNHHPQQQPQQQQQQQLCQNAGVEADIRQLDLSNASGGPGAAQNKNMQQHVNGGSGGCGSKRVLNGNLDREKAKVPRLPEIQLPPTHVSGEQQVNQQQQPQPEQICAPTENPSSTGARQIKDK